jgi:hypothetical protein
VLTELTSSRMIGNSEVISILCLASQPRISWEAVISVLDHHRNS